MTNSDSPENKGRDAKGRFGPGNPGGTGGSRRRAEARKIIEEAVPAEFLKGLIRKLAHDGLKGDTKSAELTLGYTVGRPASAPPELQPLCLPLPDLNSTAACAKASEVVVGALNHGLVNAQSAQVMLSGINTSAQLLPPTRTEGAPDGEGPSERFIPYEVVRLMFRQFKRTGELPADPHEAAEVIDRLKAGLDLPDADAAEGPVLGDGFFQTKRKPSEMMCELLDEAAYAPAHIPYVRICARLALVLLAKSGVDLVGDALRDMEAPSFGSVGMMVIGFPAFDARPARRGQARRLKARMTKMRDLTPKDRQKHQEWHHRFNDAALVFQHTGELPEDSLVVDSILAVHESATLARDADGERVGDLLKVFDKAARATGETRTSAITQLQAMAKAGRLIVPGLLAG